MHGFIDWSFGHRHGSSDIQEFNYGTSQLFISNFL